MKVIKINNYKIHLNNKKKPDLKYSKFIVYKNGVKGDLDGGYLKWDSIDDATDKLHKILKNGWSKYHPDYFKNLGVQK